MILTSFLSAPFNHTSYNDSSGFKPLSCFNHDTKILCLINNEQIYIPIQDLKSGDLVKTYKHGYKEIDLIGKNKLINDSNIWHSCMYKHKKTGLIITGLHSILVDTFTCKEMINYKYLWGNNFVNNPKCRLDDKYLIFAALSDQFEKLNNTDTYTYYHLCLKDEDDTKQYGIWADETLSETMSNQQFLKHSLILLH